MSSGTSDADFEKIQQILDAIQDIHTICLDVANGYSEHFVNYVRKVRARFPQHTIIAGNVVTGMFFSVLLSVWPLPVRDLGLLILDLNNF